MSRPSILDAMRHFPRNILSALLGVSFVFFSTRGLAGERPEITEVASTLSKDDMRKAPDPSKNETYLLEQSLKGFRVVSVVNLASRVYMKKTSVDRVLEFFLTEPNGKLNSPQQFLLAGTVVRGDRIGGLKERFYVLTADKIWRRSEAPEIYYVQDDTTRGLEHVLVPPADETASQVTSTTTHSLAPN